MFRVVVESASEEADTPSQIRRDILAESKIVVGGKVAVASTGIFNERRSYARTDLDKPVIF